MATLKVLRYPDPFLKTKAREVPIVDDEVRALLKDMAETMYAENGIGLAATQVGSDKRVIVLDVPEPDHSDEGREGEEGEADPDPGVAPVKGENLLKFVNPEIILAEGETFYEEGCLSVPGVTAEVKRAETITIRALDEDGDSVTIEAQGLLAIAFQHEIDHLDGILFIDRLGRIKQDLIKRRLKKAAQHEVAH